MSSVQTRVLHFIDIDETLEMGRYGLTTERFVFRKDKAATEMLSDPMISSKFVEAAIRTDAWLVGFSSLPGGFGLFQVLSLSEDEAANYEIGDKVLFHERKFDPTPTWPELHAIGRVPKVPNHSPSM